MKPILEIQGISKKFRINHEQQPYKSLRDSISNVFNKSSSKEDFWALKDVSFNVMQGDAVGIVGKNGAGKSTLLKILSKITPPTSGKIISRGRIASLLEVGTGFHPELTGRENVYMNGSILGMKRVEIQRNFDAIVDFAGVEKFIDTPLKHYSSGMQLRLAFAVAAFLENEILIIDEVLAVGDAEFQKKCMGKMEDVSKNQGRTVLFVSHNMGSLSELCKVGVLLNKGKVEEVSSMGDIVRLYQRKHNSQSVVYPEKDVKPIVKGNVRISKIWLENHESEIKNVFKIGSEANILVEYDSAYADDEIKSLEIAFAVRSITGEKISDLTNLYSEIANHNYGKKGTFKCTLPKLILNEGDYTLSIDVLVNRVQQYWAKDVIGFSVERTDYFNCGVLSNPNGGYVVFDQNWKIS